jgi:anti-sigma factor RsiW
MSHIDVKAYALGELAGEEKRTAAAHVAACEECRRELAARQVTLRSLAALPDEEMPRRIAFVSDKVFEPRWWQRILNPTFASACVLAAAIVFHAQASRGPSEAEIQARIEQTVNRELQDLRLALDQSEKRMAQMYKAAMNLVSY